MNGETRSTESTSAHLDQGKSAIFSYEIKESSTSGIIDMKKDQEKLRRPRNTDSVHGIDKQTMYANRHDT